MDPKHPEQQVKGVWFVSGHAYLRRTLSADRYEGVLAALSPEQREIVVSPMLSELYPEAVAADFQRAWFEKGAWGDESQFRRQIAAASEEGVNRFFRTVARISTGRFLVKQAPAIWKQLRRGPATVDLEEEGKRIILRYRHFPFFEDPLYAIVFPTQVATLVKLATGTIPVTHILDQTHSSLDTEIELP